jgi:hypothetical protein
MNVLARTSSKLLVCYAVSGGRLILHKLKAQQAAVLRKAVNYGGNHIGIALSTISILYAKQCLTN